MENRKQEGDKQIPPMNTEHIFVITELAKIGLSALTDLISKAGDKGEKTIEYYEHFKSLAEVAGPETVAHFERICQFLFESSKAEPKEKETTK